MPLNIEKQLELAARPVMAVADLDKLVLGLSTGAAVLFINLLNNTHSSRWISGLLLVSVLFFGLAAFWCLQALMRMVELQTIIVEIIQDESEDWQQKRSPKSIRCMQRIIGSTDLLQVFFGGGVFFAAVFVLVFWLVR